LFSNRTGISSRLSRLARRLGLDRQRCDPALGRADPVLERLVVLDGIRVDPEGHLPAAMYHRRGARTRQRLRVMLAADAEEDPAILLAADEDVVVEEERQPAEHGLFGDARIALEQHAHAVGQMVHGGTGGHLAGSVRT
jgi:hypothetical protein